MIAAVAGLFGFFGTTTPPVVPVSIQVAAPVVSQCLTLTHSLFYGMTDPSVADLQTFLGVRTTGYFGPLTKAAVIEWQIQSGIISSGLSDGAGVVGPKTRMAMRCENAVRTTNSATTSAVTITSSSESTSLPESTLLNSSDGSSGGTASQGGSSPCPAQALPKPAASLCTVGEWTLIRDEAGCLVEWDCSDPNATQ